jgi:hypothetical protein
MLDTAVDIVGNFDVTMDNLFVLREAAFGFLTESKESPYPWMLAAAAVAGALPLALVFFGFGWIECSRVIVDCGLVSIGG